MARTLSATDLHGVIPYLPSPTTPDGAIDRATLATLCAHLIEQGVHGLTPLGSTGEFALTNAQDLLIGAAALP